MTGEVISRAGQRAIRRADAGECVAVELVARDHLRLIVHEDDELRRSAHARCIGDAHGESICAAVRVGGRAAQNAACGNRQPAWAGKFAVSQRVAGVGVRRARGQRVAVTLARIYGRAHEHAVRELRRRVRLQRGNLRGGQRVVRDKHVVKATVEHRVRKLALAEIIICRRDVRRCDADGGGRGENAVRINFSRAARERERDVPPLADGQRRSLDNLFAAAIENREAQRVAAGTRRQKKVVRRVIAEIKNALPVRAAVPVHPRGETEIHAVRHVRGKLNKTIRAVETHRLPGVTVGETGRTRHQAVVAVAARVERVRLE